MNTTLPSYLLSIIDPIFLPSLPFPPQPEMPSFIFPPRHTTLINPKFFFIPTPPVPQPKSQVSVLSLLTLSPLINDIKAPDTKPIANLNNNDPHPQYLISKSPNEITNQKRFLVGN